MSDGPEAPRARLHRVSLCVMRFAEIEVMAENGAKARTQAIERVKESTLQFYTAPIAHRTEIRELVDFRDMAKGFRWVEIDRPSR